MTSKDSLVSTIRNLFATEDDRLVSQSENVQTDQIEKAIFNLIEKTKSNSSSDSNSDNFPFLKVETNLNLIENNNQDLTDITTADSMISPKFNDTPIKKSPGGKVVRPTQRNNMMNTSAKTKAESSRKAVSEPLTMEAFRNLIQKKPSKPKSKSAKVIQPILRNKQSDYMVQKPIQSSSVRQNHYQKPPVLKEPMSFKLSPKDTSITHATSPIKDNKPLKIVMGQNHFEKFTESYRNHLNSKLHDVLPGKEIQKRINHPLSPFRNDTLKRETIFGVEKSLINKRIEALDLKELRKLSIEEGGVCFKAKPIIKKDQFPCRSVRSPRLTEPHSPKFNTSRRLLMKSIIKENDDFVRNRTI